MRAVVVQLACLLGRRPVGEAARGGREVAGRLATDMGWECGAAAGDVDDHRHDHKCNCDKITT
jgi:hypothetical protein